MENQPKKNKLAVQIIGFVVIFALAFFATSYFLKKDDFAELKKESEKMNAAMPVTVDAETRVDSTSVSKKPLTFKYNFTITSLNKDSLEVDLKEVEDYLKKNSQSNLDTMAGMNFFRDKKVALHYYYRDNKGRYLLDYTIKASQSE